jgi:hypothetical protein
MWASFPMTASRTPLSPDAISSFQYMAHTLPERPRGSFLSLSLSPAATASSLLVGEHAVTDLPAQRNTSTHVRYAMVQELSFDRGTSKEETSQDR